MKYFLLILLCALILPVLTAEEKRAPGPEETKLIYELLEAEGIPTTMEMTLLSMLEDQMTSQPDIIPYRTVFERYLRRCVSFEAQREELVLLYFRNFTPDEMRQLIEFYRTPLGRKKAAASAAIAVEAARITQQKMRVNMPLFQEEFRQELEKRQK